MGNNLDSRGAILSKSGSISTFEGEVRCTGGFRHGSSTYPVPASISVVPAVGGATDACDITITVKDSAGVAIPTVHALEFWISESAIGAGLTADSASGALTAVTGTVLTALTAKKHALIVTAATGIAVMRIVDSANPVDQYFCVKNPATGLVTVSAASGVLWEGV